MIFSKGIEKVEDFQHLQNILGKNGKMVTEKSDLNENLNLDQKELCSLLQSSEEKKEIDHFRLSVTDESGNLNIDSSFPKEGVRLKEILSQVEDFLIYKALKSTGNNKNKASKLLHLNRTTLIEKMKKKGICL